MRHLFLALSLLGASSLSADFWWSKKTACECTTCQPPEVAYNPAYYALQCDLGLSIDAEFLYWFARENNMPYAVEIESVGTTPSTTATSVFETTKNKQLETNWSPGFRVGLDWNTSHDGWDANLTWTWFENKKQGSTKADFTPFIDMDEQPFSDAPAIGSSGLVNAWINQSIGWAASFPFSGLPSMSNITFDQVNAKWRLLFNQIDLELGRNSWIGKHFSLRPFAAIRGAWERMNFETHSTAFRGGIGPITTTSTASRNFKDKFL